MGQLSIHSLLYRTKGELHPVQLSIVLEQLLHLELQVVHLPLRGISFVFEQLDAHVFEVVTTRLPEQEVQVLIVEAQVKQFEFHPLQLEPLSIVLPASQLSSQVFVRKSSFLFVTHEAH